LLIKSIKCSLIFEVAGTDPFVGLLYGGAFGVGIVKVINQKKVKDFEESVEEMSIVDNEFGKKLSEFLIDNSWDVDYTTI
jgi:hypothetical protein